MECACLVFFSLNKRLIHSKLLEIKDHHSLAQPYFGRTFKAQEYQCLFLRLFIQ